MANNASMRSTIFTACSSFGFTTNFRRACARQPPCVFIFVFVSGAGFFQGFAKPGCCGSDSSCPLLRPTALRTIRFTTASLLLFASRTGEDICLCGCGSPGFRAVLRNQAVYVAFGDAHFLRAALIAFDELDPALLFQIHPHGIGDHVGIPAKLNAYSGWNPNGIPG